MNWYKSESTERPVEVDTTSSKTSVYLRRNIKEMNRTDELSEDITVFEYEEMKLTKEEYEKYKQNQENEEIVNLRNEVDMLTECLLEISQLLYK